MTDELREAVEAAKQEPKEYTEAEKEAIEAGWNPDKSALPEGKEFLSAEEFLSRGPLFKKIDALKKDAAELKKDAAEAKMIAQQVRAHQEKLLEHERAKMKADYEKRIAQLNAEKKQALDEGDSARVVEIDNELRQQPEPVIPRQEDTIISDWRKKNTWYDNDSFLGTEADILASEFARRRVPVQDALQKIEEHLKTKYPERFEDKRSAPSQVEGATPPVKQNGKITEKQLTPEERQVFRNFEQAGIFKSDADKAKYLKEVIELRN